LIHQEERAGDVKHSLADLTLTKKTFGYDPIIPFEKSLEATVRWYETVMV
jgi:nucleoside-diphosphate-sugar epimerase